MYYGVCACFNDEMFYEYSWAKKIKENPPPSPRGGRYDLLPPSATPFGGFIGHFLILFGVIQCV